MKRSLFLLLISVLYGCAKDLEPPRDHLETEQIAATKSVSDFNESKFGEPMVLGEKIPNPYSVQSLRKTSEKMRSGATNAITPTHYYVRFLPKDNHEYTLLLKNVRFFPFPLDRKIVENGSFYRDPDPANVGKSFSWQYAVVPAQQILPEVQYEILDELCIPENTEEQPMTRGSSGVGGGPVGPPGAQTHKVVIRVWDITLKQYIPLQGLSVNVINSALGQSLMYGVTDETGTAVMPRYFTVTKDIYYNIFWSDGKESKWFLTDGNNNQLFYNVKAVAGVTNIDIQSTPSNIVVEQLLGTIHRAAYRTYYIKYSDLLKPIHDDAIQVAYLDEYSDSYAGNYVSQPAYSFDLISMNIIGRTSYGSLKATTDVFKTTIHEFAHLNHDVNSGKRQEMIGTSERIIKESWARAVENYLTVAEYAAYGHTFFKTESLPDVGAPPGPPDNPYYMRNFVEPHDLNCQSWPYIFSSDLTLEKSQRFLAYSPVFIDLIDNENQRYYYNGHGIKYNWQGAYDRLYTNYPNDNVKGFTIGELQTLLKTVKTLEDLRDKVKRLNNLHENTPASIDQLFTKYIEHWRKYNPTPSAAGCIPIGSGGCVIYD